MSTKISVGIRMRPLLKKETDEKETSSLINIDEATNKINVYNERMKNCKEFKYTKVLGTSCKQNGVFEKFKVPELIDKVIQGYHSTIFAYGQTGAGKTYTMEGYQYDNKNDRAPKPIITNVEEEHLGIIPRSIEYLFKKLKEATVLTKKRYAVYCSYLQIYNEKVYDLLNPTQFIKNNPVGNTGLKLRYKYDMFAVENLYTFECKTKKDVMDLFHFGINNRFIATHKLNHASSRAHAIFTISVESVDLQTPDEFIISKLQLVDLAGSERSTVATHPGKLSRETIEINKSLFTLRQVILALTDTKTHGRSLYIPYRDSKLTCLLRQSVGGNSYCLMISCLSPSDKFFDENVSTLNYSTRAAYIANKPVKNEDPKTKLINDLKGQVRDLTKELKKANEHVQFLSSIVSGGEGNTDNYPMAGGEIPHGVSTFAKMEEALGDNGAYGDMGGGGSRRDGKYTINNNYNQNIIAFGDLHKPQTAAPQAIREEPSDLANTNINIYMDRNYAERSATAEYTNRPKILKESDSTNIKEVTGSVGTPPREISGVREVGTPGDILDIANRQIILNPQHRKEIDQKQKELNQLTANLTHDKQHIIHRLIQSVTMVKEVLQSNLKLRENVQELNSQVDVLNADVHHLQNENEELREKVSIIGGLSKEEEGQIIKEEQNMITEGGSTDEIQVTENTVTTSVLADILSPKNKMGIANEMVQLKKEKTLLERRVQNLEIENVNIHNKTKRIDQGDLNIGKLRTEADDFEPVRCLLTEQDIGARAIRTSKPASIRNSRQKKIIPNLRSEKSATNRPIISTLPSTALGPTKIPKTSYAKMRGSSKGKGDSSTNSWRNSRTTSGEKERMSSTQCPMRDCEEARDTNSPLGRGGIRTSYRKHSRSTSPASKYSFGQRGLPGVLVTNTNNSGEMGSQIQIPPRRGKNQHTRKEISLDMQFPNYDPTIFSVDPVMNGVFDVGEGFVPPGVVPGVVPQVPGLPGSTTLTSYNPNNLINMNRVPNKFYNYNTAPREAPPPNTNNLYKFSHGGKEYFDFKSMTFFGEGGELGVGPDPPGTAGAVITAQGQRLPLPYPLNLQGGGTKSSTSHNKNRAKSSVGVSLRPTPPQPLPLLYGN